MSTHCSSTVWEFILQSTRGRMGSSTFHATPCMCLAPFMYAIKGDWAVFSENGRLSHWQCSCLAKDACILHRLLTGRGEMLKTYGCILHVELSVNTRGRKYIWSEFVVENKPTCMQSTHTTSAGSGWCSTCSIVARVVTKTCMPCLQETYMT